jgi:hypothetical protein
VSAAKYTQAQRDEALALYETDGPSAVTARFGIPKGTVAGWAKANGTRTVRTAKTTAATEARQADAKALRAMLASDGLSVAQMAADLIKARLATEGYDVPIKDLATIHGIFVDKHAVITKLDVGHQDHSAVDKWLDFITGGSSGDAAPGGEVTPRPE